MKKIILSVIGLLILHCNAEAQSNRLCGVDILKSSILNRYPSSEQVFKKLKEEQTQKAAELEKFNFNTLAKTTGQVTIPVVFHIVLDSTHMAQIGGAAGIAKRVDSQLAVINRDFNALNSDLNQVPAAFASLIGNTQIKFAPAHRDPKGNATNGYELIYTTKASFSQNGTAGSGVAFSDVKYTSAGGANAWDPNSYLNIWVTNFAQAGLLGITMPPSWVTKFGIPAAEKGLILNYGAFGKSSGPGQYYISGADKGRTLTHELGHYFELNHIWGDDNGQCPGQGGEDDDIADTPPQADMTYGTPTYPKFDACSPASTVSGIMFMNFMDYVSDGAMHLFTKGQANYMAPHISPGGASYSLTQHPQLLEWPTAVADIEIKNEFNVYPNPTSGTVNITFNQQVDGLKQIRLLNMVGQTVRDIVINGQANNNYTFDLTGMSTGIYIVQCQFEDALVSRKIVLQ